LREQKAFPLQDPSPGITLRQQVTLYIIRFLKNRGTISLQEQQGLLLLSGEGLWDMRYISSCRAFKNKIKK
jgi:hypothetical protein